MKYTIGIIILLVVLLWWMSRREYLDYKVDAGDVTIDVATPHVENKPSYEFNAWPPPGYYEGLKKSGYNYWGYGA